MSNYNRTLSNLQKLKLLLKTNHRCVYCGMVIGPNGLSWDVEHFIPYSICGNTRQHNLYAACMTCNSTKRDKSFTSIELAREYVCTKRGILNPWPFNREVNRLELSKADRLNSFADFQAYEFVLTSALQGPFELDVKAKFFINTAQFTRALLKHCKQHHNDTIWFDFTLSANRLLLIRAIKQNHSSNLESAKAPKKVKCKTCS